MWSAKDVNQRKAARLPHEAGLKLAEPKPPQPAARTAAAEPKVASAKPAPAAEKKAGEKAAKVSAGAVTKPVRTAKVDPLAPLPAGATTAKASHTNR